MRFDLFRPLETGGCSDAVYTDLLTPLLPLDPASLSGLVK